jgi:hypothetical protein
MRHHSTQWVQVNTVLNGPGLRLAGTVCVLESNPLRFEARPSIPRAEGPVRHLLVAKVNCDGHVTDDARFVLDTPEDTAIDPVD